MTTPLQISPSTNADGTRTAIIAAESRVLGKGMVLSLYLPAGLAQEGICGRFFLARCGAITEEERANQWEIYRRRPLYAAMHHQIVEPQGIDQWDLWLPLDKAACAVDPGYRWLIDLPIGTPVNLLGPFGQSYTLTLHSRNLLLIASLATLPFLLGLVDQMLDQGGRVTLLLRQEITDGNQAYDISALVEQLPIAVEVRQANSTEQWQDQLSETVRWADQIAIALLSPNVVQLRQELQQHRFRLEPGFVQIWISSDLLCGVGACLACVVTTRDGGYTRACIHGPVFDLLALVE